MFPAGPGLVCLHLYYSPLGRTAALVSRIPMTLGYLISQYGYAALFVGVFFEGETVLILAGIAARLGHFSLFWVMIVAFSGSLAGDQFYFLLARVKGKAVLGMRPGWQKKVKSASALLDRRGNILLIGFRFVYGIRTVTPFVFGLTDISAVRFFLFNVLGAALWSMAGALAGYLFGALAMAALDDVKRYEGLLILGVLCLGALIWVIRFAYRRRRQGPQE